MGLQPIAAKSQPTDKQTLKTPDKCSVQTSVQTKAKNGTKQVENQAQSLPPDLAEIVAVWPELPGHIKASLKALIQTQKKGD